MRIVAIPDCEIKRCVLGAFEKALKAEEEGDRDLCDRLLNMASVAERKLCNGGHLGVTYF